MWHRYEFFIVSPNSSNFDDDWDDFDSFDRDYECKFSKHIDRQCINISGRQTGKSEYKLSVNGTDVFYGTNVGLHVSSIYGIPFIPTQSSQNPRINIMKSRKCGQFTKAVAIQTLNIMQDVLGLKTKPIGYPYLDSRMIDEKPYKIENTNPKPTIILTSTPSNKKGFFYDLGGDTDRWANLNLEANTFAQLPKSPWDKSGWGTITGKRKQVLNFK